MAKSVVSFDDDSLVAQDLPYLKMKKGETLRVHIPQIDQILIFKQHTLKDPATGKFIAYARCYEDKDEKCPICEALGDQPATKLRTNIIVYTGTNDDGTIDEDTTPGCKWYVLKFGLSLFAQLKSKHKKAAKKGGLKGIDLTFTCSDETFQKIQVEDLDDCLATNELSGKVKKLVEEKFVDFSNYDDRDLKYISGSKLDDILEKATAGKYSGSNAAATKPANNAAEDDDDTEADTSKLFGGASAGSEDDDSLGGLL